MISFALISSFRGWNNEIHIFIISYLTTVFLRLERIALSWLRIKSLTWSNTRRCLFRSILRFIKSNTLIPGPSQDEQAICNIIFTQKVMWETIIGSYLKHNNSDLVFQTRSIFLNEVRSWSRAQNVIFLKLPLSEYEFYTSTSRKCWWGHVVPLTAHLRVTIKRLSK